MVIPIFYGIIIAKGCFIEIDPDQLEIFSLLVYVSGAVDLVRQLPAGSAPGRPEIEQQDFTL